MDIQIILTKIYYILQICMIAVPIIAIISTIINSHKKEYKEITYHITSKDNKNDDWFTY